METGTYGAGFVLGLTATWEKSEFTTPLPPSTSSEIRQGSQTWGFLTDIGLPRDIDFGISRKLRVTTTGRRAST